ncbi:MAG TPA: hypothetical protein VF665_00715, partial [Longimicrobium sp.]|uniref:hypothetical protein n=1 Tax=Longimicrobium sp. TaxID=2029185 RepID=UPI002EDB887E
MRGLSRTLVFSAAALALTAGDAHGQLGGIARRAAGRVVGGAAAQAAQPAAAPAAASRAPRFDDETLEITTDVVNRFVLALNTEATERQKLAAERAAAGSMRAEVERYERCTARAADQRQDQNAALSANDDQLAMRMTQAILRNDTAAYRRMTDSLVAAQARNSDSSVC